MYVELPGANPTIVSYSAGAVKIYSATCSQVSFENKFFSSTLKNALSYYNVGCSCNLEVVGKAPGVNVMIIFCDFRQFSAKKLSLIFKTMLLKLYIVKIANCIHFSVDFLKIITLVPTYIDGHFPLEIIFLYRQKGRNIPQYSRHPRRTFIFANFPKNALFPACIYQTPFFFTTDNLF
jgi:hypothetical protein